jgi:hypothetical protein
MNVVCGYYRLSCAVQPNAPIIGDNCRIDPNNWRLMHFIRHSMAFAATRVKTELQSLLSTANNSRLAVQLLTAQRPRWLDLSRSVRIDSVPERI